MSAEVYYNALSTYLRNEIPMMNLVNEILDHASIDAVKLSAKHRFCEDNESCIKIAKAPALTPWIKCIALKYHYFYSCID